MQNINILVLKKEYKMKHTDLGTTVEFLMKDGDDYKIESGKVQGMELGSRGNVFLNILWSNEDGNPVNQRVEIEKLDTSDEFKMKLIDLDVMWQKHEQEHNETINKIRSEMKEHENKVFGYTD